MYDGSSAGQDVQYSTKELRRWVFAKGCTQAPVDDIPWLVRPILAKLT